MYYKITLKPLDNYFFGTNKKFYRKKDKTQNERTNYNIDSYKWPQQTSLLGMLRKQILIWNGEFKANGEYSNLKTIKYLIGENGFQLSEEPTSLKPEERYGVIKKISPVFLEQDGQTYTEGPFDIANMVESENSPEEKKGANIKLNESVSAAIKEISLNGKQRKNYVISDYNSKSGFGETYVQLGEPLYLIKTKKDFFQASTMLQVKIQKNQETELFRKEKYNLKSKTVFVFYAEIDNLNITSKKEIVFIGGDKSAFELEISKVEDWLPELLTESFDTKFDLNGSQYAKIYALSDIYLTQEQYDKFYKEVCGGSINYTNFNCFTQKINTINRSYKGNGLQNSRHKMIKRGSFFIVEEKFRDDLKKMIEIDNEKFKQIGYNYIIG